MCAIASRESAAFRTPDHHGRWMDFLLDQLSSDLLPALLDIDCRSRCRFSDDRFGIRRRTNLLSELELEKIGNIDQP